MPATSELQIYAFESAIERATASVLNAAGYADTFVQGANATLPESRLEITFATGDAINETAHPTQSGHVYDFFDGRLVIRIVTVRPEDRPAMIAGVMSLHEEWAAGVRVALQERNSPFTTTNLPYLTIKTIRPAGTTRDLDPRWLEDYTRLEFFVQFGIRSDAWPA